MFLQLTMSYDKGSDFLTVQEVSTILKISVLTVYKYIKSFKLGAIELGGRYRIPRSSLLKFVETHKVAKRNSS